MISLLRKFSRLGPKESFRRGFNKYIGPHVLRFRFKDAPIYQNPSVTELEQIELKLKQQGLEITNLHLGVIGFETFNERFPFPPDYHGGPEGGVWTEKLLEHFIAHELCGLAEFEPGDRYIDVAGSASPWASMLREHGIEAYSVDLAYVEQFSALDYYLQADATDMPFEDASVRACSLQCAYEMFNGDDDRLFLDECSRVLRPGGVAVIVPLYMHTRHCGYASPEYFGKGYADPGATEFINWHAMCVPFSRKYSAGLLRERILEPARQTGLAPTLYRLANKSEFGSEVYCHFILVLKKEGAS